MAKLATDAPALQFDTEDLKKWGYIWRIGTNVRKKAGSASEDEEGEASEEQSSDSTNDGEQLANASVPVGEPGSGSAEVESEATSAAEGSDAGLAPAAIGVEAVEIVATVDETDSDEPAMEVVKLRRSLHIAPLTSVDAGLPAELAGKVSENKYPSAFTKKQGMDFGLTFDRSVGAALSKMLGDIDVVEYNKGSSLLPPRPECVEVGPARIIGGVRPQNFDVAYRPDGLRIAYDSKTLNDTSSVRKNWQNMVNDLGTEATTVHTRFPYAIVAFIVAIPKPALPKNQEADIVRTLERLATRESVIDQAHLAEAIALIVWDPVTGEICPDSPSPSSSLRHENFMAKVFRCYTDRYKGLPPHDK